MSKTDLSIEVIPGLRLSDPLMIASSHHTSSETAFLRLASIRPAALTLKTTSERLGGPGQGERKLENLLDSRGKIFAKYSDGPKEHELWDLITTRRMSQVARRCLPDTKIGLSVLQGEQYSQVAQVVDMHDFAYVELNWKYTFRQQDGSKDALAEISKDLSSFFAAFRPLPCLVKLSREALPILDRLRDILLQIRDLGGGLIVANSKRLSVPPSRLKRPQELTSGVIVGEYLFLETFNALRWLSSQGGPPLVASGGVVDVGSCVDVIAAGANAVQLCTALDVWGIYAIPWLRENLSILSEQDGSFSSMALRIRHKAEDWYETTRQARLFQMDLHSVAEAAVRDRKVLLPILEEALQIECSVPYSASPSRIVEQTQPKAARMVITRANAASLLLGYRFGYPLHLSESIVMPNARAFEQILGSDSFHYDFAILTQSSYRAITKKGNRYGPNTPHEVGNVGMSRMELVTDRRHGIEAVSRIYHFGGNTAITALLKLLQERGTRIEEIQIKQNALVPLLRYWRAEDGILAKPPLSRMDGLLCEDSEVRKAWGPVWHYDEPLVLVASERSLQEEFGSQHAEAALARIHSIREDILKDPKLAVRDLISEGFVDHCLSFLIDARIGK